MKDQRSVTVPRVAKRLLQWYCRPELIEDLEGDLNEFFHRNLRRMPPWRAKLIYIIDVVKFIRPYTLRKPTLFNTLIHWIMLGSYIKTSARSISRNKFFSAINIVGLAISMSIGLLLISFLTDLHSYDRFHANVNRIFRVTSTMHGSDGHTYELASNSIYAGKKIKETVSGIEEVAIVRAGFSGDARADESIVPVSGFYASPSFFSIFSFSLIAGNPATVLKAPNSIVLTEETAKKLFGNDNEVIGKTLMFDTIAYQVTGVMKDIPKSSHMRFESLVSLATFEQSEKSDSHELSWSSVWQNYIYILLPEETDPEAIQKNLDNLAQAENKSLAHESVDLSLQPLKDIVLGKDLSNQIGQTMILPVVWIVSGLALIVILSACFNYTNLSIARALRRSKEVGVRKVIGAMKSNVMMQFLIEAIVISLLSLIAAIGLFVLLRPGFLGMAPELSSLVSLDFNLELIGYFVLLAIAVGIIAGILPAVFFSKVNALSVLKNSSSVKIFRHVSLRKALVVVQYTFSLIFISTTVIGVKQYSYLLSFDLGFQTENIVNIRVRSSQAELLTKELKELPEVTDISQSLMVTSIGSYHGTTIKYTDPHDSASVYFNRIDERYFPLHGHQLIAGKNFQPGATSNENDVIVNEEILKRFNIGNGDPQKALGEQLKFDRKAFTIIGVVKNFSYGTVDKKSSPVLFRYIDQKKNGFVNVKVSSKDLPATMARIESAWKKIDPVHPINAAFYDDQIEKAYSEYKAMIKVIGFLSFLAVSVASLGLFGMVVFTTETRLREMSIRKVLGAPDVNLIYLLSRGFILLLCIAALIALPFTYVLFDQVVLADMANKAPLNIIDLLFSLSIVLAIAFFMIGSQALRVMKSNPAQVLKVE